MGTNGLTGSTARTNETVGVRRAPVVSLSEQARRYRWGKEWGPKVGQSIREYIAANGG